MSHNPQKQRCSALTKKGKPCRKWARPEEGGGYPQQPLCSKHDPQTRARGKRRCTARRANGQRCRSWAMLGQRACQFHARRHMPAPDDPRRCVMRLADGSRCPCWIWRDGDQPLCYHHSRPRSPKNDRRCTAPTMSGRRCRNWVMPEMLQEGKTLCRHHAHGYPLPDASDDAAGRRCTAMTTGGTRCRKWALIEPPDEQSSPLCAMHAYPEQHPQLWHGYFSRLTGPLAALQPKERSPEVEIWVMRQKLDGILAYTRREELSAAQWIRLAQLVTRGLRKAAQLESEL